MGESGIHRKAYSLAVCYGKYWKTFINQLFYSIYITFQKINGKVFSDKFKIQLFQKEPVILVSVCIFLDPSITYLIIYTSVPVIAVT